MKHGMSDSNKEIKRPDSIKEALRMVDEALAGHAMEFKELAGDEYQHIKKAVNEFAEEAVDRLKASGKEAREVGHEAMNAISALSNQAMAAVEEHGGEAFRAMDTRVRANPWPAIGGVALGTFVLGVLLGSSGLRKSAVSGVPFSRRH